jgi:hypothetical protein
MVGLLSECVVPSICYQTAADFLACRPRRGHSIVVYTGSWPGLDCAFTVCLAIFSRTALRNFTCTSVPFPWLHASRVCQLEVSLHFISVGVYHLFDYWQLAMHKAHCHVQSEVRRAASPRVAAFFDHLATTC